MNISKCSIMLTEHVSELKSALSNYPESIKTLLPSPIIVPEKITLESVHSKTCLF